MCFSLKLHKGDLADTTSIYRVISEVKPYVIYNEADQDHVSWSYSSVDYSCDITGSAVARILEIIKQINPSIKFFQPLSSNMFGKATVSPQNENSSFNKITVDKNLNYLLTCKNVILTPHIAGLSKEANKKLSTILINKILELK